ncbi:glycosyltransferase [Flavobacteriaceae bacterium F08102]|nr:glycosyltransferase [Flavobacteriaceae bacterium F08102]
MPRIIFSVSNDLSTDQRVHKICTAFQKLGYEVLLVGRKRRDSLPLKRSYKTHRMRLVFSRGFLFYAEFSKRLFITLLFSRKNVLYANDLDTLLPNFLISKLTGTKLIYDSHELFSEIPELQNRSFVKRVWLAIERLIFKRLKNVITVNEHIAGYYEETYGVPVNVVRNLAPFLPKETPDFSLAKEIKGNRKMLILQGSGINRDRGAEEAVKMMQYLENTVLYIVGSGDVVPELKRLVTELHIEHKVQFLPKMPYDDMMEYTKIADLGLSLDKSTNLNYQFSLPNKVFDYIQARTPLLVSPVAEVKQLVESCDIGYVINTFNPESMATIVKELLADQACLKRWNKNLDEAALRYNWEKEVEKLIEIEKRLS